MKSKLLGTFLVLLFSLQSTSCGTLMFSQRSGQKGGKIDANVIIMDAFGLLIFLVPGLVALGVDFATGAVYLPPDVELGEGPFISDPPKVEIESLGE